MMLVAIIKKTCEITLFFPTHQIHPQNRPFSNNPSNNFNHVEQREQLNYCSIHIPYWLSADFYELY